MSYTWGSKSLNTPMVINGRTILVSSDLAEGLQALAQFPDVAAGKLKVWNDFICLNQLDKLEIQRELKHIPFIFSNAQMVLIWLGPAASESYLVMELFQYLDDASAEISPDTLIDSISNEVWLALLHFLHRPYWRRLWILQELALADPSSILFCGTIMAPLRSLWKLLDLIFRDTAKVHHRFAMSMGRSYTYYDKDRHNAFSVLSRLQYLYRAHQALQQGADCDSQQLMNLCRGSSQLDPRDKIYGIFGLLSPKITTLITPDLSATPLEVYADFVRALVKTTKRLNILQTCRINYVQEKFPSWVPDLEVDLGGHLTSIQRTVLAGTDVDIEPVFSHDGRLLHVKGCILDAIDHLTPPQWPLLPVSPGQLTEARPVSIKSMEPHDAVKTTFWQTLTAGNAELSLKERSRILRLPWPESHESVETLAQCLIEQGWATENELQDLLTFLEFRERAGPNFDIQGIPMKSFFDTSSEYPELIARRVLRQVSSNIKRRRLIITKNGKLGIGVREAKPGDIITVLLGCDVPLILRIRSSVCDPPRFMVVGDCFIHGLRGERKALTDYGREQ